MIRDSTTAHRWGRVVDPSRCPQNRPFTGTLQLQSAPLGALGYFRELRESPYSGAAIVLGGTVFAALASVFISVSVSMRTHRATFLPQ